MSEEREHDVSVGVLENEGFDTGCVGAFCGTCVMWVGPHRDLEEEAEEDARRHNNAVREQRRLPAAHQAFVRFDQEESDHVDGLIEDDPDSAPDFGPYYAHCEDCHGDVSLGRMAEDEAASEARQHRDAFAALTVA